MVAVAGFDFAALPPEVTSAWMYTGAGSAPLLVAATAWSGLAGEIGVAAHAYTTALSELTGATWQGSAATAMSAAAAPYTVWMHTTASQLATVASQARAAAAAYETAFAAVAPPPVIAANRSLLTALVATNLLGQNSAAIAATEAQYAEMWAQDAAAMYGYAAASAASASLPAPATPPATTTDTGAANQAAAAAHAAASATGNPVGNGLSHLLSSLSTTLQSLTTPGALASMNIFSPANVSSTTGLSGLLNEFTSMITGQSNSAFGDLLTSYFSEGVIGSAMLNPENNFDAFNAFDFVMIYAAQDFVSLLNSGATKTGAVTGGSATLVEAHPGGETEIGPGSGRLPVAWVADLSGVHETAAGLGRATLVKALSVPPSWTAAATTAIEPTGPPAGPATASLAIGAGPTAMPSPSLPRTHAVARPKGRFAGRQYGFRPTMMTYTPAGG